MSFILDALKKSETERQRETAPSLSRAPLAQVRNRTPIWIWLLLGSLSIAVVVLIFAWWNSTNLQPDPLPTPVASQQVAPPPIAVGREPAPAAAPAVTLNTEPNRATTAAGELRSIAELASLDASLPTYRLEVVAYNSVDPNSGSAWINGRRYYVGVKMTF